MNKFELKKIHFKICKFSAFLWPSYNQFLFVLTLVHNKKFITMKILTEDMILALAGQFKQLSYNTSFNENIKGKK